MDQQVYCKYCKKLLVIVSEINIGYHESCYHEVRNFNPIISFQENFHSHDKKLVETLLSFNTSVSVLDNKLIYTYGFSKIIIFFSVKSILYIDVQSQEEESEKVYEIRLDSNSSSLPSKYIIVDYFSHNPRPHQYAPFLTTEWTIIYTIFDWYIERILINVLDLQDLEKIIKVKELTSLHFHAVNEEFILFYTVFPSSSMVRIQVLGKKVIGIELYSMDQKLVEQILELNFHYLTKMILKVTILKDDDPVTLYQLIKRYDQLEQLIVDYYYRDNVNPLKERNFDKYYFDLSIIEHMNLQVLGILMYIPMITINSNYLGKIKNIPKFLKLRYLILKGVELPVLNEWDVNCLYYEKKNHTQLSNFDFLPDHLNELLLEYFSADLNPYEFYTFTKKHPSIKKLILLNATDKKELFLKEKLFNEFCDYFPNAEINIFEERLDISKFSPFLNPYLKGDWYFQKVNIQ